MIFRLRTGHCRLRSHMIKIGIEKSALCPWGQEVQTTVHVLQSCPLHKEERKSTWPTEKSLGNKLHGTITNLRLTVRFIVLTGLHIWQVHIERWRKIFNVSIDIVVVSCAITTKCYQPTYCSSANISYSTVTWLTCCWKRVPNTEIELHIL